MHGPRAEGSHLNFVTGLWMKVDWGKKVQSALLARALWIPSTGSYIGPCGDDLILEADGSHCAGDK